MAELWTPPEARVLPGERKSEGGSYFDDELETEEDHDARFLTMAKELLKHVQLRPDHVVYVGSSDDRHKMRAVFNSWREYRMIDTVPTIKIDYGVPDGTIRVDEDRS